MRSSLRLRMTLACVALVVGVTAVVLLVSWNLLDRHVQRTLPPLYADRVADDLARQYLLAIVGAALIALGIAWAAAGRLLAPVRAIAATARRVSSEPARLDQRVGVVDGADDELHALARTFDGMLDRVQDAAAAQRRFVANASHELRTPMTVIRAEAEVALDDPDASVEELRAALHAVVETGERTERLLDGLLVLAGATEGVPRRERVDLALAAGRALRALGRTDLDDGLCPVVVAGDELLLERLVANLVENALRHGRGEPAIMLRRDGADAVLTVRNEGDVIPPKVASRLVEPFERGDRARGRSGAGLGLSIVAAIARAHGGTLVLDAPPSGGLVATVRLPAAAPEVCRPDPGRRGRSHTPPVVTAR